MKMLLHASSYSLRMQSSLRVTYVDFNNAHFTPNRRVTLTINIRQNMILNFLCFLENVDIWCIGILTYEFLTGDPPSYSENQGATYQKIVCENVDFSSKAAKKYISPIAQDFMSKVCSM